MKTVTEVHSYKERLALRTMGERRALRSQLRWVACVSILRTAVTRILPLCGSAGWWMALACLLPALALYGMTCLALRLTHTSTLTECVRAAAGRFGVWLMALLLAAALLLDGASSMTALVTLFVEGVHSAGTQVTLAILTGGGLLFCLNRDGLARGSFFLRRGVLLAMLAAGLELLFMGRADHLFPVLGGGVPSLLAALRAGIGLGWPLLLLLTAEPVHEHAGRFREALPPVLLCGAALLCLTLALPGEVITERTALAESLILAPLFMAPALKMLTLCLWMAALFLQIGCTARLSADTLLAPSGRELAWLPYVLTAALTLTQCIRTGVVWDALGLLSPWLLLPMVLAALNVIPAAVHRRKRP